MSGNASRTFKSKYNIAGMIQQLQKMCLGTLFVTEDGKISFVLFNPSGTVQRTLTNEDMFDVRVDTTYGNLVNKITFTLANDTANYQGNWSMQDTASQTNHTPPSGSAYVAEQTVDFGMLKSRFYPSDLITSTSAVDITLLDGDVMSLCGTRGCDNPGSQPADAKISTSRPLYLRIENEIIKETDALTISATGTKQVPLVVDDDGKVSATAGTGYYTNATLESSGMTRGALSTTAAIHPAAGNNLAGTSEEWLQYIAEEPIQDLTIPERWGRMQLARFSNGCPIVSFKTNIRHADLQIGDLVYLTHQLYAHFQDTSSTTATTWELINKEVDPMTGVISWKAARATRSSITSVTSSYVYSGGPSAQTPLGQFLSGANSTRSGQDHITGMQLAAGAGLTFTIDKGNVNIGLRSYRYPVKITYTVEASKDTYVYIDRRTGAVALIATTTGSGYPSDDDNNLLPLGLVVSGASSVSSVTYFANTKPISSAQTAMNSKLFDNFIVNGDFELWSAGGARPPDGWQYIYKSSQLTTDPRLESPAPWGTGVQRIRTSTVTGGSAVKFLDGGSRYKYLIQTEMVPVNDETPYMWFGMCTDDSYATNDMTVKPVMFEYDKDRKFIAATYLNGTADNEVSMGGGGLSTNLPFGASQYEIHPDNSTCRFARFGFQIDSGASGSGSYFVMDNIKGFVPAPTERRYRTTDQTGIVTSTWTTMDWSLVDLYARWLSQYDTSTDTYTVPLDGTYVINAMVKFINLPNGTRVQMRLTNSAGTELMRMGEIFNNTGGASDIVLRGNAAPTLSKNDTFKIQVWHNAGSNKDIEGTGATCWYTLSYVPISVTV